MSEDNKVVSITTLAGEFDKIELQTRFNTLFLTAKKQAETIQNLNSEIAHLKILLSSSVPIVADPTTELLVKSDEEELCKIQINMLKERYLGKEMSFEDAKKLEILVKTLKLIENKDNKPIKANSKKVDLSDELLLSLAAEPVDGGQ